MKFFVGTSGWRYSWNPDGLEWYLKNTNLNAVELNSSFYKFPFIKQVKGWKNKMKIKEIKWSIKVNRVVTHVYKLNEKALKIWKKFEKLFNVLEEYIDFYLFQLPPNFKPNLEKIKFFVKKTNLKEKFALEARNAEWFKEKILEEIKSLEITFVSIDAPYYENLPREIYNLNGIVYLRMHGRTEWYAHYYSEKELNEVANKVLASKAKKVYIFFNNNHAMLENAEKMLEILNIL